MFILIEFAEKNLQAGLNKISHWFVFLIYFQPDLISALHLLIQAKPFAVASIQSLSLTHL